MDSSIWYLLVKKIIKNLDQKNDQIYAFDKQFSNLNEKVLNLVNKNHTLISSENETSSSKFGLIKSWLIFQTN